MQLSYKIVCVFILKLLIIIYLWARNANRVAIPVSQSNVRPIAALSEPTNITKFKVGEIIYEFNHENMPLGEGATSNVYKGERSSFVKFLEIFQMLYILKTFWLYKKSFSLIFFQIKEQDNSGIISRKLLSK